MINKLKSAALAAVTGAFILTGSPVSVQEAFAQEDKKVVEITTHPLGNGIYMLMGDGGNIGVSAGDDGVFIIDDQFAPLTAKIVAALKEINPAPVSYVLNTHWHFDHTGGNENFGHAGATIVAHDNVRARMSVESEIAAFQMKFPPAPEAALPVITYDNNMTFHLNGDVLHVSHVKAAHTDGDSIIHFANGNVLHMGDTFFNGFYPFYDLSNGGSINGMIAAAERGLALADDNTKIIPGHGPLGSKADLAAYHDMLVKVRNIVKAAVDDVQTPEDFIASVPTADLDAEWGDGLMKPAAFLAMVYHDLSR